MRIVAVIVVHFNDHRSLLFLEFSLESDAKKTQVERIEVDKSFVALREGLWLWIITSTSWTRWVGDSFPCCGTRAIYPKATVRRV